MISYPLREYISSKKNDDYFRLLKKDLPDDVSSFQDEVSSSSLFCRICCGSSLLVALLLLVVFFSSSFTDPTCFKEECLTSVCNAYEKGLIGGQLCPELCTSKTIQLENCLGKRRKSRSRLFDLNEENELIRCYFRDRSNRSDAVGMNYSFPQPEATLDEFSQSIEKHLKTLLPASDVPELLDRLFTFVDFNRDGKISLSEGRSLWSLIELDEFVFQFASAEKSYSPRIFRSCGQLFTVEKIAHPHLPFNDQHQFDPTLDHPNWYQRVRIAVGIVEFYLETIFPADAEADALFLCSDIFRSFGYQNNYEAKMMKYDELVSRGPSLSVRCSLRCESKDDECLTDEYLQRTFTDLRRFLSEFVLPDGNETFVRALNQLHTQMDETIRPRPDSSLPSSSFVRPNLLLQNLRNLLWTQIEFQLNKITKKPSKTPSPAPLQSVK